jgi:kumamolisin
MAKKKVTPRFSVEERVSLPGSERSPLAAGLSASAATPAKGNISVSVVVKRKQPLDAKQLGKVRVSRAEYRGLYAADPVAVKMVKAFAAEFGLAVAADQPAPERRTIVLTGSAAAMQKAFGVSLSDQQHEGCTYRVREGEIQIPAALAGMVEAVLGLDNRPQARAHFRVRAGSEGTPIRGSGVVAHEQANSTSYTPVQVAELYQFPKEASGTGQTIGLIELGGGFRSADVTAYFKSLGQTPPTVVTVSVDKGKNKPTTASGADGEVMLDIEVAAAVAPGAKIVVYFAPNTDQGFIDAISTAVHDTTNKPGVISISWGGPESSWTGQAMTALDAVCQSAAALGVTITVACGDNGSTDGVTDGANHVDFPASSPHVLACGGTKLEGSGGSISSEVVWNELGNNEGATGGGVSTVFAKPSWQANVNVPASTGEAGGRGLPDVAGDADPASGYTIRVDGQTMVIGGTSAVAPLWAGLIAVANKQNGTTAGFINPTIYGSTGIGTASTRAAFRDITEGNNGGFAAAAGWDACTGLGSPIGTKLIALLAGPSGAGKKKGGGKGVPTKEASR